MRNILLTSIALIAFAFLGNAQNCPTYSPTVTATGEACGGQDYLITIENNGCNSEIYFDYLGTLGYNANPGDMEIVSIQTGAAFVTHSGTGSFNGIIGPIDPSIHGTAFNLIVTNGSFTVSQSGNTVAQNSNYTINPVDEMFYFAITISSATLTVTLPSGAGSIVKNIDNCKDFNVQIPLSNTNFCTTLNVNLPWTITCDATGATIVSGTHSVIVNPQVPANPSDLVDITWNTTTCSWDVSPNFDCDLADIGTIFSVSPDPTTVPLNTCVDGNVTFTVDYLGVSGTTDCCSTAGAPDPITYVDATVAGDIVVINSPLGGVNNAGYINFPPNNIGGDATSFDLCVSVSNYCFEYTNNTYSIIVNVDGVQIGNYTFTNPGISVCFDLSQAPGYDQNSNVDIYVYPMTTSNGGVNSTFVPTATCGTLNPMEWRANITATINVEFEDSIGTALACTNDTIIPFVNCIPPTPTIVVETAADCNTPSTLLVTNYDNTANYTFFPVGPVISNSGVISGSAGSYMVTVDNGECDNDITFTIDPGKPVPTFTVSSSNPTVCSGTDGIITISGLANNTNYNYSYEDGVTTVGPIIAVSNGSGVIQITGLSQGSYTNFSVDLNGCAAIDNSIIDLVDPVLPVVDAGIDQTICAGTSITLTANNPSGAVISWNNGVTDGVPFTPAATQTYTATATLNGCISTDDVTITITAQDIPTFNAIPDFCENIAAPTLPVTSLENISGTWSPAIVGNTLGTTAYTFTPDAGICATTQTMDITVHPVPTPTITAPTEICVFSGSVALVGNPNGGTFSGAGMTNNIFDPNTAGLGTHTITYSYTDGNNCSGTTTTDIVVNTDLVFTTSFTNPTTCGGSDGTITIQGLANNSVYIVSYTGPGGAVGPNNLTSNGSGEIVIPGLIAGTYTGFYVEESNGCFRIDNSGVNLSDPNAPGVNAGPDQTVCQGTAVALTASGYPGGANISWNHGVVNNVSFLPAATQTYTVTAELNNCISTDAVTITVVVKTVPTFSVVSEFCPNTTAPTLPTTSNEGVNGTWSPAIVNSNVGTTTYTFTPNIGECAIPITFDITVHPLPTPTIDPVGNLCATAGVVTLVGTPSGGTFSGPGVSGNNFDPSVANTGANTITYSYTDGNNCTVTTTTSITVYSDIVFTLSHTNPTACNGTDGTITLGGLESNEDYSVTYIDGATVGPTIMTSNNSGNIIISGLDDGSYSGFEVLYNSCVGTNSSIVVLSDPTPPNISAGPDAQYCEGTTVVLTASNPDGATISWNNGVTDGVGFVPPVGVSSYTLSAELANCFSSDQITITVSPAITGITCPPALTAACNISQQPAYANFNAFIAAGGSASIPVGGVIDSSSFNLLSEVSNGNSCPETITRTYQISDTCGVAVTCTQIIEINDLIDPTGTAPADTVVQCTAEIPAVDITSITDATDNCTTNPIITHVGDVSVGSGCYEVITRTYNIADACGNNIDVVQIITIEDNTAPTGTAPADITVQCAADLPAVDVTSITDAADNCTANPIVTHVSDVSSGSSCLEVITRTYNIADDCGNNIDVVQTITIQDDTAPTGTVPNDTTVVCIGDVPLADISLVTNVADNCTATPTVTHAGDVSDGNTCPEIITRTYNIVDDCGNSTNLIQTITINDDVLPTASNPDSIAVACLVDVPVVDITVVTDAADNCTAAPTVAFVSETSNGNTCNGEEITRIYSVTDDCGNSIDVTQIITINLSAPSFTVSGTDPTTCLGSDGTITLSGLDASTNYDISYNGGATISVTSDASGEYTITGLSAGTYVDYTVAETACSACSTTENVSITLTDPNPPTIDAGLDLQVCEGESISLNAVNPDAANLTWNNGVVDGVGFIPPVGTTTYNVIAELANCFTEDSLEVVVNPLPVVSAGSFLEVCEGEQVTLSGSGANTYVWDNGVTDGVPFTPPVGTTTYTVTGESVFGCEDTDQVQVRVLPAPIVSFTANTREGCAPEEINLISTTTGVSNQCRFTIEGGTVLTGCNVTNIFTTAGCYDVNLEVEAANGCSSDITIVDYICIDNYPVADFSVYPEELSTFNNSGEFTNESSGAVTYDWDFGDSTYSNAINPNHVYSVSENSPEVTYEVKLIAYSPLGCADSTVLSLPYFEDLIYNVPNTFTPDGNLFNETFKPVFTSGFDPMEYKLKIYNRWGELIFESNDPAYGWDGTYGASNIIFAPEGTYLWKISFKKLKDDENVEVVGSVNLLR